MAWIFDSLDMTCTCVRRSSPSWSPSLLRAATSFPWDPRVILGLRGRPVPRAKPDRQVRVARRDQCRRGSSAQIATPPLVPRNAGKTKCFSSPIAVPPETQPPSRLSEPHRVASATLLTIPSLSPAQRLGHPKSPILLHID